MRRKKINAPRLFYQFSLETLVPQDHVIRKIDKFLDFGFLYAATKPYYAHGGKPSVDPIALFKLCLLGRFLGIPDLPPKSWTLMVAELSLDKRMLQEVLSKKA